jgi:hypothetical protein
MVLYSAQSAAPGGTEGKKKKICMARVKKSVDAG